MDTAEAIRFIEDQLMCATMMMNVCSHELRAKAERDVEAFKWVLKSLKECSC